MPRKDLAFFAVCSQDHYRNCCFLFGLRKEVVVVSSSRGALRKEGGRRFLATFCILAIRRERPLVARGFAPLMILHLK